MKHIVLLLFITILLVGCSGSIDTTNMTPEEKLNYAVKIYNDEDYEEAVTELQAIILQYPGNAVVDDAQYYLGMTRFQRGEYILAGYEFSKLIKNMTASEFVPVSQFMLAQCYYLLSPNFNLDQRYSRKAIEEYQAFIDFFPANEKVAEAESKISELNEKLALKEYSDALIYEKLGYHNASIMYYSNIIEVYHDTKYAPQAMYNKILLLMDRNRNDEALTEINKFLSRFSDNNRAEEVQQLKSSLEAKLSASR